MKKLIGFALVSSLLTGIAYADSEETLIGYSLDHSGITYQVESRGCTKKDDFRLNICHGVRDRLALIRERPDPCQMIKEFGTKITYSWDELAKNGLETEEFLIGNALQDHYHLRHGKRTFDWVTLPITQ